MLEKLTIEAVNALLNFGVLGIFVLTLGIYIYYQNSIHQAERKAWRKQSQDQFTALLEVTERNSGVVHDLKGTLESIERRL